MRLVPPSMTDAWKSEAKVGPRRPVVRATISLVKMKRFPYDTRYSPGADADGVNMKDRMGYFATLLFGVDDETREIPNIRSYTWSRSVDSDVAEATLTLRNAELRPIGEEQPDGDFELPGFFSPNRGTATGNARWGHSPNSWADFFVPDRLVRTYEGYGTDPNEAPGTDPHLVPSGTWLIDTVTTDAGGDIVLKMRDLGRLLLDQIVFPPVIPNEEYPLIWEKIHSEDVPGRAPYGGRWSGVLAPHSVASSSNEFYRVELDESTGMNYVERDGTVQGHKARHAITRVHQSGNAMDPDDPEPYWLSTGQERRWSKVYWETKFNSPRDLAALRMSVIGGPYVIYVSLQRDDGTWYGAKRIPYEVTTKDVDLRIGKRFVHQQVAERAKEFDIVFKRVYRDVRKVRITFTRLWDTRVSTDYPWHAGLKNFEVYWGNQNEWGDDEMHFDRELTRKVIGNYRDFTDIVKTVCAWGGFFWPGRFSVDSRDDSNEDYMRIGWDQPGGLITRKRWVRYLNYDIRLAKGRVWGDFMNTGTATQEGTQLGMELFDKQPLLDVISYLRDVTGFLFYIDETGAAVWRMPNIFEHGNYLSPTTLGAPSRRRTQQFVTIDDAETLLDWRVDTSSESNREIIFVSDVNGRHGVAITGYSPANAGLRRAAGWTDTYFVNKRESRTAADMIATRQMHAYRRGSVTIPGYPAIQVDDQIRIFERVTSETFFHYVLGIQCNLDMESGEYTYQLTTHWLGEDPDSMVVDTRKLNKITREYIASLDLAAEDNGVEVDIEDEVD